MNSSSSALKRIEDSNKGYHNMLMHSPFAFSIMKGKDMEIILANNLIKEIWGKGDEVEGKPLLEVLPEWKDQPFPGMIDSVYVTGNPVSANEILAQFNYNGKMVDRYFNIVYYPHFDDDETISGVVTIANEVTAQVLARKKIEESEQRFRNLVEKAPSPIYILKGEDMVLEVANEPLFKIWHTGKEALGKPLLEIIPEMKNQPFIGWLLDVFHNGATHYGNEEIAYFIRENGEKEIAYFNFVCQPYHEDDGSISGVMVLATNVTEQVLSRKKIEESEEQFSTLVDNMENLAWLADGEGFIYWYNKRWYEYTGTTLEVMKGWGWQKVHHPDHVDRIVNFVKDAWYKNQPFELTFPLRGHDGVYRWFLTRAYPIADEQGKVLRWIGTNTSIDKQKKAEEEIEYRKALLEAHNEASFDGLLLVDAKGKIISYNHRFVEIWNMPQQIVEEKNDEAALAFAMTQLVNPEQFIEKVKWLYEHPTETSTDILEYKDGKIVERHGYPVIAEDGSYYAWSWTFRDITEFKKAELVLRQSEENFRQLAELMPDKVTTADAAGNVTYYSKNWELYTGISRDQLYEKGYSMLMHPGEVEALTKHWQHSVETGDDFETELRIRNEAGEFKWHLSRASAVKNEQGKIIKWIGSMTQIQHQKEQREELEREVAKRTHELEQSNEQLLQSNEDLQRFAHVASHDLREPLRKIKTFANRLDDDKESKLSDKGSLYLEKVKSASDRMNDMIEGVLAYSMINASEQTIEEIDLGEIFKNIETDLEVMIQQKEALIRYDVLPKIEGAQVLIYQLFYNLVNNSLKFTKPEKKQVIRISSTIIRSERKEFAEIILTDTGIGFEHEYAERIFSAFTRLHSKEQYEGTGLGLTLCKKIVERHSGTIKAIGAKNKGAKFIVTLPLKQSQNKI